jgi:hypothetical protein
MSRHSLPIDVTLSPNPVRAAAFRRSSVAGHRSLVVGRRSLVAGRRSVGADSGARW